MNKKEKVFCFKCKHSLMQQQYPKCKLQIKEEDTNDYYVTGKGEIERDYWYCAMHNPSGECENYSEVKNEN